MLPTTPAGGYFRIWRRFCHRIDVELKLKLKFPVQLYVCLFEMMFLALSFFTKRKNCTNLIFSVMVRGTMPFSRTGQMWPYFLQSGHIGATWDMPNMPENWIHEYFGGKRKMKIWFLKSLKTKCWCWWEEKRCIEPSNSIGYWGRDNQPISTTWRR